MRVYDLGTIAYVDAWRLQEALATRLRAGGDESLLLLEHPHVFTIGRRGTLEHLTASAEELRRLGAQVYRVDRGGDITYHGPGQLVAYPVIDLQRRGGAGVPRAASSGEPRVGSLDVVAYVRALEDAVIRLAAAFDVVARRVPERTGVWVTPPGGPPAKLCSIGVRVSRGVTTHGLALNVTTDLSWFERMIPCGFAHQTASLAGLGVRADVDAVKPLLARALAAALEVEVVAAGVPEAPRDAEIRESAPVRGAVDVLRQPLAA